jgi:hypothetical protein
MHDISTELATASLKLSIESLQTIAATEGSSSSSVERIFDVTSVLAPLVLCKVIVNTYINIFKHVVLV